MNSFGGCRACQRGAATTPKPTPKKPTRAHKHRQLRQGELGGLYATIRDPEDKTKFIKLYFSPKVKDYINEKGIMELPRAPKNIKTTPKNKKQVVKRK